MNLSQINKKKWSNNEVDDILPLGMKDYYALCQLIKEVLTFVNPADISLSQFFREHKNFNSLQKMVVAETVYGLLRNYYKITQVVSDKKNINDIIGLVWVKILQLPTTFYMSSKFKLKFNIDYTALSKITFLDDILSITELPQFIIDKLLKQYTQDEMIAIAKAMQLRAGLDLRVNIIKTDIKAVLRQLQQESATPQLTKFSPYAIRLMDKTHLLRHKLFLSGDIEIQDESSQLSGMLLAPRRGDMVVDFCAGGGGKTLLLGMLMRNTGRIYAFDVNKKRLNNLTPRLQRSGLSNVHPQLIANENDIKVKRLYGKIDRVFVDAPCSGFGTLRRNPELKFRQCDAGIIELNIKQQSILAQAAKLLKPNGYLVYATCSILQEENQDIIENFLLTHPEFRLLAADSVLRIPELKREDGFLLLLPNLHNTDGFFAALLQRVMS